MTYNHLINACRTKEEYADLALLFAGAALAVQLYNHKGQPIPPAQVHTRVVSYRDAVRTLAAIYEDRFGVTLGYPEIPE